MLIPITQMTDCAVAQSAARRFARGAGLDDTRSAELAIAAGELASNIVKHGGARGELQLRLTRHGIHLVASDRGPGLTAPELFLKDGLPRLGRPGQLLGLGCGSAALGRLLDNVRVRPRTSGGLLVHGVKRLHGGRGR